MSTGSKKMAHIFALVGSPFLVRILNNVFLINGSFVAYLNLFIPLRRKVKPVTYLSTVGSFLLLCPYLRIIMVYNDYYG